MLTIRTYTTPDNNRRLDIYERGNGLFCFEEAVRAVLDNPNLSEDERAYWKTEYESGQYDTAEAAEADARAMVSWLDSN